MKKSLVISIISTFCLTSIIFLIIPVHSYTPYTYDPWLDVNDDGRINLIDTFTEDLAFGTSGTPVNKTALLYNVSDTLTSLLAEIDSLNSTISGLQSEVQNLNATHEGFMNAPAFDSGWISIAVGETVVLFHNLNTTEVFVYVVGKSNVSGMQHQRAYGMCLDNYFGGYTEMGLYWARLDANSISVIRGRTDDAWDFVHVMIWKIP